MLELPFKIVIPSHHRPEAILKNPLYGAAHVVVNDDAQVDEYREAAARANITPGEFVVCGPQPSIAAVRNFIVREVWDASEPFVIQMDDDFYGFQPTMHWRTSLVANPVDVAAVFWESYISSNDAGAHVFGYAHKADPKTRNPSRPISLRGWLRAVVGVSDHSLYYDDQLYLMEDLDISLAAQAKDRIIWQDHRWAPVLGPNWAKGGISHTRTEARRLECYERINRKYGPRTVVPRLGSNTGKNFSLTI